MKDVSDLFVSDLGFEKDAGVPFADVKVGQIIFLDSTKTFYEVRYKTNAEVNFVALKPI